MTRGLIISHMGNHCGVYQFGRNLFDTLAKADEIAWSYCECSNFDELKAAVSREAPDAIIFNHHPSTMPWLTTAPLKELDGLHFGLLHQVSQEIADAANPEPFDFLICLDPTLVPRNPRILRAPRFSPVDQLGQSPPPPDVFTVGSFGFATPGKGFDRLCALVNSEFDRAKIRINIPVHDDPKIIPEFMLRAVIDKCRAAIDKPGIELEITHHFLNNSEIVAFLASNTINAFLYEDSPSTGISSCADFALASGRPFALTRTSMFRHFFHLNPSVFIEERKLADIAAGDMSMLNAARADALPAKAAGEWNHTILAAIDSRKTSRATPDGRGFNKILDDRSRTAYHEALGQLTKFAPEMIARKIERANIQQAFGLDVCKSFLADHPNPRILAAGSFEDTAVATLRAQGYRIDEIDPNVNGMTLQDFYISHEARLGSYDLVVSISVLEHVADDEQFVRIISEFLRPGGLAVLTVDFADAWRPGIRKPEVDHRLYTTRDICERLIPAIGDCVLVDPPRWFEGVEDFEYEGSHYGFAGLVFRKLDEESIRRAAVTPVWREMLEEARRSGQKTSPAPDKMTSIKRWFSPRG
jgi:SAM-dependent methyltransferase